MNRSATSPNIPLPTSWPKYIKSSILYVIALAHTAMTCSRGWAANSRIPRVQMSAELDEARNESSLLREEMRIKDARMARIPPKKRPFYSPTERMAILELRAARGWTLADTAEKFLVEPDTISSWMKRSSDQDDPLVQIHTPVNKYSDFVRLAVQRLKTLCPLMGKLRMAQVLAKAGLRMSASTVGRITKQDPVSGGPDVHTVIEDKPRRVVTAKYPDHVWHIDLTIVPTTGFWVPWKPFSLSPRWPNCWWVAVIEDQFSRMLLGFRVFLKEPTLEETRLFLADTIATWHRQPKHLISDQGPQFLDKFTDWCKSRSPKINPRKGAVGQHGSIAIIERFIRSMKNEVFSHYEASQNIHQFRRELTFYSTWYNQYRTHQGIGGRIPADVYFGVEDEVPPINARGPDAVDFQILVSFLEGRRHLPIVEIRQAAA